MVLVGDRGMITTARIEALKERVGVGKRSVMPRGSVPPGDPVAAQQRGDLRVAVQRG